jgi:NAD-dependent SIR2 family protein deacetylase
MTELTHDWCKDDKHQFFELFSDFNEWIDKGEAEASSIILKQLGIGNLSHPSKAFFAGDKAAYEQSLRAYRLDCRHQILSKGFFQENYTNGGHWFERNEQRFNQLIERLSEEMIVPFVGAGVSVAGGFPTWANHLRQQGITAGIASEQIEAWLSAGLYEQVIEHIEQTFGPDVFAQEIRDAFSKTGSIEDVTLRIAEVFSDTLITTNYDRLLEQVFDTGSESDLQVINGMTAMERANPESTTIIKIHGDIKHPQRCILGKAQYDAAYGEEELDLERPIPKLLKYYFKNSSLLFIGCSLSNDRTIQVFKHVKELVGDFLFPQHFTIEQAPETQEELVQRNAELLKLGITAIWYEKGRHDKIESILNLAKNELNYKLAQLF